MISTRVRTAGKLTTTATVMLVLTAKLMLTRLPMAPDAPLKALLLPVGPMLLLMATVVMPNVPVATVTPTRVLMPTETRTLMLLVTAMPTNTVMDVTDPALTTALADGVAGKLESTAPPMPVLGLKAVPNMVLMAVTGKMPAVTATLLQTPLHAVLADGALVLRVQLMLLLARMAGRTATSTVVMPRTPTVMNMVLLMPALADTVAATLMAVALVLWSRCRLW